MIRVFLTAMEHEPGSGSGRVRMRVKMGDGEERVFHADYDGPDEAYQFCSVEGELFMRLSKLAVKRYCHCMIYQMELMGIIGAFVEGEEIPALPIELGTTEFGLKRPSAVRVAFDRMRRPFLGAWYWWAWRHLRRENLRKYGEGEG